MTAGFNGNYGWASVNPIKTIDDLKKTKLRIGEAPVNKLTYKAWGTNPVVMLQASTDQTTIIMEIPLEYLDPLNPIFVFNYGLLVSISSLECQTSCPEI